MVVVESLEVVDIQQHHGQLLARLVVALPALPGHLVEAASVGHARERILAGQSLQPGLRGLEFAPQSRRALLALKAQTLFGLGAKVHRQGVERDHQQEQEHGHFELRVWRRSPLSPPNRQQVQGNDAATKHHGQLKAKAHHQGAKNQDGQQAAAVHARVRAVGEQQHRHQAKGREHTADHRHPLGDGGRQPQHEFTEPPANHQEEQGNRCVNDQTQAQGQLEAIGHHHPVREQKQVEGHQGKDATDQEVGLTRSLAVLNKTGLFGRLEPQTPKAAQSKSAQHRPEVHRTRHDPTPCGSKPASSRQCISPSTSRVQTRLRPLPLAA